MSNFNWREHISLEVPDLIPAENAQNMLAYFRQQKSLGTKPSGISQSVGMRDTYVASYSDLDNPDFSAQELMKINREARGIRPLSDDLKSSVESVLEELSLTPEGQSLIRQAAANSDDGVVRISEATQGYTEAKELSSGVAKGELPFVLIGADYNTAQYLSGGEWLDLSLQDAIIHELGHISHDHHAVNSTDIKDYERVEGVEGNQKYSANNEHTAISISNDIMQKYYAMPPRNADDYTRGTRDWGATSTNALDVNQNFNPDGYDDWIINSESANEYIKGLPEQGVDNSGPELQSLYEVRNHPEMFKEQFTQLRDMGALPALSRDVKLIETSQATELDSDYKAVPVTSQPATSFDPSPA